MLTGVVQVFLLPRKHQRCLLRPHACWCLIHVACEWWTGIQSASALIPVCGWSGSLGLSLENHPIQEPPLPSPSCLLEVPKGLGRGGRSVRPVRAMFGAFWCRAGR